MAIGGPQETKNINILIKKLAKLRWLITRNDVTNYKAQSTAALADMTDINTEVQASSDFTDLPTEATT